MIRYESIIENLNRKLNFNTNQIDSFNKYFNFIEKNEILFEEFIKINKTIIPLIIEKYKEKWIHNIILKLDNDINLFVLLITCILFKNILNNSLISNNFFDKENIDLKPFLIPRNLLIFKIKKDLKGFLIYYNINTEEISHYELKKSLDLFILILLSEISNIENSPLIISKLNTITKGNILSNNYIKTPIFYSLKNKTFYIISYYFI